MSKYLNSLNIESILKVIHILCFKNNLSVYRLSDYTGLSVTNISKILDFLVSKGIVSSVFSNAEKRERKCHLYYIKSSYNSLAVDLSSKDFKLYSANPGRPVRLMLTYAYNNRTDFENNITYFKDNAKFASRLVSKNKKAGTIRLLPGQPDSSGTHIIEPIYEATNEIPLPKLTEMLTYSKLAICEDSRVFRAKAIRNHLSDEDLALVLFLDNKKFSACMLSGNTKHFYISNFGENYEIDGTHFMDRIKEIQDPFEMTDVFAKTIADMYKIISFSHVCIVGDYISRISTLVDMIRDKVHESIPDLAFIPYMKTEVLYDNAMKTMIYEHIADSILYKQVDK